MSFTLEEVKHFWLKNCDIADIENVSVIKNWLGREGP